jgi:hypothetical protein
MREYQQVLKTATGLRERGLSLRKQEPKPKMRACEICEYSAAADPFGVQFHLVSESVSQKERISAEINVYQSELNLKKRVDAIRNAGQEDPNLSKIVIDAAQAGEDVLKLMKTMADKNQNVASQMKNLADRRLKLAEARNKLLSEDRIREAAAKMNR